MKYMSQEQIEKRKESIKASPYYTYEESVRENDVIITISADSYVPVKERIEARKQKLIQLENENVLPHWVSVGGSVSMLVLVLSRLSSSSILSGIFMLLVVFFVLVGIILSACNASFNNSSKQSLKNQISDLVKNGKLKNDVDVKKLLKR